VEHRPSLVGIDSVNIDDLADQNRPAHTKLLAAGVLILEHLTGLAALPARGARLHAAPPPWSGVGTWPVRAYALVPADAWRSTPDLHPHATNQRRLRSTRRAAPG
jgi:kynurenine formamidase